MEVAYVGTTQVKESKIHMLVSQYEVFKMQERESIKDFVQRFILITNQLIPISRTFDNANIVHKVLRSLIEEWQPKVTTIKEFLKIRMPTIQELYRNLEEHELDLKRYKKNGDDKRKKSLALKALSLFHDEENELNDNDSKENEDEVAFLCKKL